MYRINIVAQDQDNELVLTEGTPVELGLSAANSHMTMTFLYLEVMVWIVGHLQVGQKQKVIDGTLGYLADETIPVAQEDYVYLLYLETASDYA